MAEQVKQANNQPREVRAILNDLRISPRKVRLVTDLIKGKSVGEAERQLRFLNKKAAGPILKLVRSAAANARNNFQLNPESLLVKNIVVNQGIVMKRIMQRAQGRAFPIERRTSRVIATLTGTAEAPKKTKRSVKRAGKTSAAAAKPASEESSNS